MSHRSALPVLAIDIGGTKLAAGLVGTEGQVLSSYAVPTPPGGDADTVWSTLLTLLDRVLAEAEPAGADGIAGVGVGCGGPMQWPAGEVSPLNLPGWRGFPLRARLQQRYPEVPVRLHNDAVALVAAEHWQGAGRGYGHVMAMVVATGVGAGLIFRGHVVDGATGNAGHVGHIVVEPDGPVCGCGGRGCLEAIARGPALAAWAVTEGWHPAGPRTAVALADDARSGDPAAAAAFDRAGRALGIAIASAVQAMDLERVVIGGGLSGAWDVLSGPLLRTYRRHAGLPFARPVTIVPAELGRAAGLVGAAALVVRGDAYWNGG